MLLKQSLSTYNIAQDIIKQLRCSYQNRESKLLLTESEHLVLQNAFLVSVKLYNLTKDNKYIEQAYNFSESSKASNLLEASTEIKAIKYGNIPDSITQLEQEIKQKKWILEELIFEEKQKKNPNAYKLNLWNNKLFATTENYNKLKTKLGTDYPKYHKLKYDNNIVPLKDIKASIGKNEIIIEYMLIANRIFSLQISSNNYKIYEQKIESSFYSNLNTVYNNIKQINLSKHNFKKFNDFKNASENLYSVIIQTIEKNIANKELIIIPDGILAYLPFEVLLYEKHNYNKINYRALPYFIYKHAISYSYSASLYSNNMDNKKKASKKLAIFAPEYNPLITTEQISKTRQKYREQLLPLEGIIDEAKSISHLTGGEAFLNKDANENTFKNISDKYDILHFAMHSVISDKNPMYSKMIFSMKENSENDGFLNTFEIYNLQLNCRMAVLSSCNSGSGKLRNGEGVMSLARAFMYAGCPSIVMTLWTVNDISGEKLMTKFYYYLKKQKSKAKALQQTKIDILNNSDQLHSHPYFWANYIVIGNKKPVFINRSPYIAAFIGIIIFLTLFLLAKRYKKNKSRF
ncbi:MAG: CHAT domain-containing protein [Bacteroidales bacterium]|jgi:CHAT domain-containing protein|nr:CHAT domain-containing protein [Bacteroidales bacterium]